MNRTRIDVAYAEIKERILSGEFSPSQHLVEAQLVQALGVGRHTVRLALERLDTEGLVTIERNRGAVVRTVSLEDALDILLAREVLEGAAARLAAVRIDKEGLAALRQDLGEMEEALSGNLLDRYSELNVKFHQTIYDACGSRKIPELITSLRARVVRLQFRTILVPGRGSKSLSEHQAIYRALTRYDEADAESAMRTHVSTLRNTLIDAWDLVKT